MREKKKSKLKRRAALILTAVLYLGAAGMMTPIQGEAAQQRQTCIVTTTQRCSIWSAPSTAEENRVKYVDEGYQITVYPEVVGSEAGDGKTFYRTVRDSYVLCKCVTGAEENSSATVGGSIPENGGSFALIFPPMPEPPSLDRNIVRSERSELLSGGPYDWVLAAIHMNDFDASGNRIKTTVYAPDGTLVSYETMEYDLAGNVVKYADYDPDASLRSLNVREYDAVGNNVRQISYDSNGNVSHQYIWGYDLSGNMVREIKYYNGAVQVNSGYEYDALGNKIKYIDYHSDGTVNYYVIYEYDAQGTKRKQTSYDTAGNIQGIRTFHLDGSPDQWGIVRPDGNIYWVE